ncbi:hypothetical protein JW766_05725 [Candidatus Dojkabacteria bacterium]|nr:hypothetical protein [Candidatus Dojkabacteria bacterium]
MSKKSKKFKKPAKNFNLGKINSGFVFSVIIFILFLVLIFSFKNEFEINFLGDEGKGPVFGKEFFLSFVSSFVALLVSFSLFLFYRMKSLKLNEKFIYFEISFVLAFIINIISWISSVLLITFVKKSSIDHAILEFYILNLFFLVFAFSLFWKKSERIIKQETEILEYFDKIMLDTFKGMVPFMVAGGLLFLATVLVGNAYVIYGLILVVAGFIAAIYSYFFFVQFLKLIYRK